MRMYRAGHDIEYPLPRANHTFKKTLLAEAMDHGVSRQPVDHQVVQGHTETDFPRRFINAHAVHTVTLYVPVGICI